MSVIEVLRTPPNPASPFSPARCTSICFSLSACPFLIHGLLFMKRMLKAPASHRKQSANDFERSPPEIDPTLCPPFIPWGFWKVPLRSWNIVPPYANVGSINIEII